MYAKYKFKLIVSLFVILYVAITFLVFNFYRELALKDARREAFYVLDAMSAIRDYVSSVQRPLIDELKQKGVISEDFFDPRLLSSSYITREIYKIQLAKQNIDYDYKLVATDPLNPEHEGNKFENEILEGFKEKKYDVFSKVVFDKNSSHFFVSLPIKNSQASCLECHTINSAPKKMIEQYANLSEFRGQIGDTIAMISFKIPLKSIVLYHTKEIVVSGVAIFVVFAIFLVFIYKIHKKEEKNKRQNELLMIHQSRLASMGQMIGNISHQWRQPLAQISSALVNLELFSQRDKLTKEKLQSMIDEASAQIKFMSETIEDFKNFFNPNMPKSKFAVSDAINQARKILDAALKRNLIEVKIDIKENFNLFGNINEIIQVLINIINNAKEAFILAGKEQRSIIITAALQNGERIITIQNNASKIDANLIDKIFEPHFTTKAQGSGLGLYMSRMILSKNNAAINVKNLNEGVVFTINFKN